ncbi:ABC transporter substrate-binding protein [Microbacterium sp. NPDC064584]|uniref:ABC transporter substrate-binding protein n=1 Tax=Microbacterium sp. NPDC064584 TaxID=3155817 RepID=UPI003425C314
MTLRQSQFVPPVPLIVARECGLLDGIGVETSRTMGSPAQLTGLLAGDIDIAITSIDNLYAWASAGADLRLVAQVEATTPLGIYARPAADRLTDLEGVGFGVDAATNGFSLVARYLLGHEGVTVDYIEVGGVKERLDALLGGDVAATLLGPPFDAAARDAGATLLATVAETLPAFPGQGLVVRSELVGSDELAAYLDALGLAVDAGERMTDAEGEELLERAGFGAAAAATWASRPRTLEVDPDGLTLLAEIRSQLGLMPPGIRLEDLHDPAPLRLAVSRHPTR